MEYGCIYRKKYYQGTGWYRRTLTLPQNWQTKQVFLKLDAASKAATVYMNGRKIGEHNGGYTACTFDITPFCSFDAPNSLAIHVDNARQDIPPISADFTFFGGIYRDVWLTAVPKQHFHLTNYGSEGIFISTPQVSEEKGTILIRGEIKNDAAQKASLELEHTVYNPDGSIAQTQKQSIQIKGGELYSFRTETAPILSPRLWTPETPHLYRVESILRDKKTKAILDHSNHHTGFRWFSFDGKTGFSLNGKPYKLRGICRHQDQKPIGVALTDEMHRRDMKLMKEMGANFIRISHYPQDDALLEMCDKLGMLAWEEIPIIDIVPDTPGYAENCENNLREMIRQHYNHPSIITWGYMNEILLVTQRRYKKEEELKPVLERTLALANRLEKVLKEEDSTRASTMAFHGSNSYNEVGLGNITDIVGWNLYQGWYGGDLTGFERFLAEQHKSTLPTRWLSANTAPDLTSAYIRCNHMLLISVSSTSRSTWNTTYRCWKKRLTFVVELTGTLSISLLHCAMNLCRASTIKDWCTQTVLPKTCTITIKPSGVKTFPCCTLPAVTGRTVAVYNMERLLFRYPLRYIPIFRKWNSSLTEHP